MTEAALAGLHHLLAFFLVATLAVELTLLGPQMTRRQLTTLLRVHLGYLVLFPSMLVVGVLRAAASVEGLAHYATQPIFGLKMGALLLALLTAWPTSLALWRWHRRQAALPGVLPRPWEIRRARHWMHLAATAFVAVPMLAAFLARHSSS
jgi:putative membrane protein